MKIENTDKIVCRELASLLVTHGIKRVFISPGSRNAPIIVAIARRTDLITSVVVDERSAAFMALGYASVSGEPVALVCTSGTALLNYAPAVAEAYYRRLPLIVISADRPAEWIDQDDSQTLRQPGALDNYVKLSVDIPEITTVNLEWYGNRVINDALITAQTGRKAPVHINIQLDNPLGKIAVVDDCTCRTIRVTEPRADVEPEVLRKLYNDHLKAPRRVMIIAGFNAPDPILNTALDSIAHWCNVVVLTESISNLHSHLFLPRIDTLLCAMSSDMKEGLAPDLVITLGGALVSRLVKDYIRGLKCVEHWHVGIEHTTIDCFQHLTRRIEIDAGIFFSQLSSLYEAETIASDYNFIWHKVYDFATLRHDVYMNSVTWSDMSAFALIMSKIPGDWNLQLSNGTPIRYAQLFGQYHFHRSDCNRGVSGIDGCTSTAIGASIADAERTTLLISGDMSAQYDIGAFASLCKVSHFKMIVLCNGGGAIFRFIQQTASLPELDHYFSVGLDLPLKDLAVGYGVMYYEAYDESSLECALDKFINSDRVAILAVYTPAQDSANVLKNYFASNHRVLVAPRSSLYALINSMNKQENKSKTDNLVN